MCKCGDGLEARDLRYQALEKTLNKYRTGTGKIIPVLQEIQDIFGYIPEEAIRETSRELNIPSSEIYGVVTFYGQFHLQARGQNIIKICTGTACHVQGGGKVLEAIKNCLGLGNGKMTTDDMMFTLEPVACLGACGMAPVMMVNEDAYGRLTPEQVPEILARYDENHEEGDVRRCIA